MVDRETSRMIDLNELAIFSEVAQQGSFIRAAERLGTPKSTVSRRISQLEERLGVQLLKRSTRQLKLTEAGGLYFEHCQRMMEEADNAEHVIQTMQAEPSGLLRVTSIPCIFNGFFADLVGDFLQRYPRVRMDIVLDDRHLDFVADEIDVAFRIGPLLDSDLVARRICTASLVFCATPHYLAQHGMPLKPEDLHQHTIIRHPKGLVILNVNGEARHVDVPCRLQVNDHKLVQSLTRKHFGIGLMPRILAEEGLHKGSLVEILSDTPCVDKDLFLVYPSRKQLPSKIIAFVDMVMSNLPGEDSCLKLGDDDEVLLVDQGTVSRPRR